MAEPVSSPAYTERLWPSPGMWLLVPLAALSGALMVAPYGAGVWVTCALIAGTLVTAAMIVASPSITVRDGILRAGRAQIPVYLLGEVRWAEGEEASAERGTQLDARAFLVIRGWVDPVVKVRIEDTNDPTPYWLVSTRRPRDLTRAIVTAST